MRGWAQPEVAVSSTGSRRAPMGVRPTRKAAITPSRFPCVSSLFYKDQGALRALQPGVPWIRRRAGLRFAVVVPAPGVQCVRAAARSAPRADSALAVRPHLVVRHRAACGAGAPFAPSRKPRLLRLRRSAPAPRLRLVPRPGAAALPHKHSLISEQPVSCRVSGKPSARRMRTRRM